MAVLELNSRVSPPSVSHAASIHEPVISDDIEPHSDNVEGANEVVRGD